MEILRTVSDLRRWRAQQEERSIGFVPTMGALHAGHMQLIEAAVAQQAVALVSIFVNPTQFNDPMDCEHYPTPLEQDMAMCRSAGVAAVFLPDYADLYPDGYRYAVTERGCSELLEGAHRPGHFTGMLTVVLKLLKLARASVAYFGEKDWQQLALVRDMANAFFLDTEIKPMPTVREPDGLAMSSRNVRLSSGARALAPRFAAVLRAAPDCAAAAEQLTAAGFAVDYVEEWDGRRLGAVVLEGVRLIDNIALEEVVAS